MSATSRPKESSSVSCMIVLVMGLPLASKWEIKLVSPKDACELRLSTKSDKEATSDRRPSCVSDTKKRLIVAPRIVEACKDTSSRRRRASSPLSALDRLYSDSSDTPSSLAYFSMYRFASSNMIDLTFGSTIFFIMLGRKPCME